MREAGIARYMFLAVVSSVATSCVLASFQDRQSLNRLEGGGPKDCSDCTDTPFVFYRCYTAGAFDPCSTISCMTITLHCAQCDPTPSVDDCQTESVVNPFTGGVSANGTETTTDTECNADTPNSSDPVDLDTNACTGPCAANAPCQNDDGCGSGSQYGFRVLRLANNDRCIPP